MKVYDSFKKHEHDFNVAVLSISAMLASITAGAILIAMGILETDYLWMILAAIFVIIPVVTFVTSDGNTEFKTAFYKTWQDVFVGRIDQRKILQSFVRKYKISNYRIKPKDIEADGRWNFRADTNYMRTIISQRNMLLDDLGKEYSDEIAIVEERIITKEKEYNAEKSKLEAMKTFKDSAQIMEKMSKVAAEKYFYREKLEEKIIEKLKAENSVHEALRQWNIAKKNKENLEEVYKITVSQINKIFNERYAKYTETAIKKLNRIHGLKFRIADVSEIEKGV